MLTQNDFLQLMQIVQSETRKVFRSEMRTIVEKEMRKMVRQEIEIESEITQKDILELKKNLSGLKKDSKKLRMDIGNVKRIIKRVDKKQSEAFNSSDQTSMKILRGVNKIENYLRLPLTSFEEPIVSS